MVHVAASARGSVSTRVERRSGAELRVRESALETRPVEPLRLAAAHQQQVGPEALDAVLRPDRRHQPQRGVRKDREERLELDLQVGRVEVVVVEPLAEQPARGESGAARSRRNSRVKRFETPVIHGFEGSETITSKAWRASAAGGCARRGTRSRSAGRARAGRWRLRRRSDAASQVAGSISTHSSALERVARPRPRPWPRRPSRSRARAAGPGAAASARAR